jgi:hypothetical protein
MPLCDGTELIFSLFGPPTYIKMTRKDIIQPCSSTHQVIQIKEGRQDGYTDLTKLPNWKDMENKLTGNAITNGWQMAIEVPLLHLTEQYSQILPSLQGSTAHTS